MKITLVSERQRKTKHIRVVRFTFSRRYAIHIPSHFWAWAHAPSVRSEQFCEAVSCCFYAIYYRPDSYAGAGLCISCLLVRGFVLAERRARRPGMLHTTDATIQRSQLDVQRHNGAAQRRTRDVRLTDVCGWCQVLPTWEQRDKPRTTSPLPLCTLRWQKMCTNDRLYLYRITGIVVFFSRSIFRYRIDFDPWLHDESVVQSNNDFTRGMHMKLVFFVWNKIAHLLYVMI